MTAEREPCAFCGDREWTSAHYTAGRLVCQICWQGRAPAVAMPPTAEGKRQLELWMRPRTLAARTPRETLGRILP
jgi:recombinational DNA repair protein (RecF pathway)